MRAHTLQSFQSIAPWAGSFLLHGILVLVLLFEGAQHARISEALPPGKVSLAVPARVVARPVVSVVTARKRVKLTAPDSKVALPHAAEVKTSDPEPVTTTAQAEPSGGGTAVLTVKERYLYGLRTRIEQNKTYPAMSKRLGETGRVLVSLALTRDGSIKDIAIQSGSSFDRLDHAALETVKAVARYEPIPAEITDDRIAVEVPIEYRL